MLLDWLKIQMKNNTTVILLEEKDKKKLWELIKTIPPSVKTQWNEERSVTYHVYDNGEWIATTSDYKMAYDIFDSRCKQ